MAFFFVLILGGWHYSVNLSIDSTLYRSATAACLTAIIVTQIVNVFVCRQCGSLRLLKAFARCVILAGVALEIRFMALFDYSAWGNLLLDRARVPLVLCRLRLSRCWQRRHASGCLGGCCRHTRGSPPATTLHRVM